MKIMVFGAHDDDWDEYCGGTMMHYVQAGHQVAVVSLTSGCNFGRASSAAELRQKRTREFEAAAAVLGNCKTYQLDPQDGHLENTLQMRIEVARVIHDFLPDVIFTHPPDDYHPDHNAACQLVLDASLSSYILAVGPNLKRGGVDDRPPRQYGPYPIIYFYDSEDGHGFLPEDYVDITGVWESKVQMLVAHYSQYEDDVDPQTGAPQNFLVETAEIIGRYRGLQRGVKYAEAFRLYRAAGRVHPVRLLP